MDDAHFKKSVMKMLLINRGKSMSIGKFSRAWITNNNIAVICYPSWMLLFVIGLDNV